MTTDKHAKRAARDLAAREGISCTAARRRLTGAVDQEHREPRPPVVVMMARTPCPEGCEGFGHPGAVCRVWRPADVKGGASWEVRRAAELPGGRAEQLTERVERPRQKSQGGRWSAFPSWEDRWLLALVYTMLTAQRPELLPDRARLRAAVEADDLAAVDTLMEPLDRAAARLVRPWHSVGPSRSAHPRHRLKSCGPGPFFRLLSRRKQRTIRGDKPDMRSCRLQLHEKARKCRAGRHVE